MTKKQGCKQTLWQLFELAMAKNVHEVPEVRIDATAPTTLWQEIRLLVQKSAMKPHYQDMAMARN